MRVRGECSPGLFSWVAVVIPTQVLTFCEFLILFVLKGEYFMKDHVLKLDWLGFTFKADISIDKTPLNQFLETFPEFKQEYFVIPEFRLSRRYSNCLMY